MIEFKNRGHYCNYCRKIIENKIVGKKFQTININQVIWHGWDHPEVRSAIIDSLMELDAECSNKEFNGQLRSLMDHYGFKDSSSDRQRKSQYKQRKREIENEY